MTGCSQRLRAAALGLAALLAPAAARAQLPTIDVAAIAKAVEMIQKAQDQIDKVEELRAKVDDMSATVTNPWADLAAEADALRTSAMTLPAALGTPPRLGSRLQARLDGSRSPLPGEPPNADYTAPPGPTQAQITAAITPTAAGDPLAGDRAGRLARETQLRERARRRIAADRQRRTAQSAADGELAGTAMHVRTEASTAFSTNEASTDLSWASLMERNAAMTQTVGVLQSQLLAFELAEHERRTLERQDALSFAGRQRIAALQAAAASKAAHAAYMADPGRDAGDGRMEECGGRFFTAGCETVPAGF